MASTSRDSPAQRRPSYTIAGTLSFRGSSGDKALRRLTEESLAGNGPLTFTRIVRSEVGIHYFRKFCAGEDASEETLAFWLEARGHSQMATGIHREHVARKIFTKFLDNGATHQLAMPAGLVDAVRTKLHSHAGPDGTLFDDVFAEVSHTLRYDVFPRFLTSSHFFKLVNLTLEERIRFDVVRAAAAAHTAASLGPRVPSTAPHTPRLF